MIENLPFHITSRLSPHTFTFPAEIEGLLNGLEEHNGEYIIWNGGVFILDKEFLKGDEKKRKKIPGYFIATSDDLYEGTYDESKKRFLERFLSRKEKRELSRRYVSLESELLNARFIPSSFPYYPLRAEIVSAHRKSYELMWARRLASKQLQETARNIYSPLEIEIPDRIEMYLPSLKNLLPVVRFKIKVAPNDLLEREEYPKSLQRLCRYEVFKRENENSGRIIVTSKYATPFILPFDATEQLETYKRTLEHNGFKEFKKDEPLVSSLAIQFELF